MIGAVLDDRLSGWRGRTLLAVLLVVLVALMPPLWRVAR